MINLSLLLTTIVVSLLSLSNSLRPPFSCDESNLATNSLPFCNTGLPIYTRVRDLVSRLTIDEKIKQMVSSSAASTSLPTNGGRSHFTAFVRMATVSFSTARLDPAATMFPQVILTAASFDPHLWYRIAQAISDEARAIFNAAEGQGMTFMAPNVNIFRDPRWGRGHETPNANKDGLLKASACCKHLTAYDLESWNDTARYVFDAKV